MITSVYLSNNNIRAVVGQSSGKRIRIRNVYSRQIQEGSLINGVITNESQLSEELAAFWSENQLPKKRVELVISSSEFVMKTVTLPVSGKKKTLELLSHEYADADRGGSPVYDYLVISRDEKKKTVTMLSVMADRSFLEVYLQLFRKIGIQIQKISTGLSGGIKLIRFLPEFQKETSIVQYFDGNIVISMLLAEGEYIYSQRTRLFSEAGSEAFAAEVSRVISQMRQFYAGRHSEIPLSRVYVGGLTQEQLRMCGEELKPQGMELYPFPSDSSVWMPDGESAGDHLYSIGNLIRTEKDINLYRTMKLDPQVIQKRRLWIRRLMPVGILFALCLVVSTVFWCQNASLQKELDEIYDVLDNQEFQRMAQEDDELLSQIAVQERMNTAVTQAAAAAGSYPYMNQQVYQAVQNACPASLTAMLQSYAADSGSLDLVVTALNVEDISHFIDNLYDTDLFLKVNYTGYSYMEDSMMYTTNVICCLHSQAGK